MADANGNHPRSADHFLITDNDHILKPDIVEVCFLKHQNESPLVKNILILKHDIF